MFARQLSTLTVALCLGISGSALATQSRSESLLFNMAIEDQTDVFMFPHQLNRYQGAYFHAPENAANIFGGIIMEHEGSTFGIFAHRPVTSAFDQLRLTVTEDSPGGVGLLLGNPGSTASGHVAGQAVDILYTGGTWGAGLRIHIFDDDGVQTGVLADPVPANSSINVEGVWSTSMAEGYDLRAKASVSNVRDNVTVARANVGVRNIEPGQAAMKKVWAGDIQLGLGFPDGGDTSWAIAAPLKAGVQFTPAGHPLLIGLLAGIDIQVFGPDGGDTEVGLAVPTLEMATEWTPKQWLQVRGGLKSGYGWQFVGPNDTIPAEQLVFSSGLGFIWGAFHADTVFQYSFLQNGPDFVGGTPGLFTGVTFSYDWSGAGTAQVASNPGQASQALVTDAPVFQSHPGTIAL